MKRAYKLQEFVAHSSNVNCLKIGRKTSRVLVTGGEDHKVNMWAIGRPNPIMSLSGHTSAVESVTFDTAEALVAAGAASGTIKLWDLEEAKIVRTLTGHRSNCISVDFHPFGEFFASGSLDTNLKIWDIRRKGCIHTYKGHTRGVNAIKFSPDGRWVVSGGEDNIVKLWDLTAGKLMHDFKCHEGQIMCLDFHPHEFLLATGSADRTVKFWDLETFELIGSAGPEVSAVRSMIFNPDGRALMTGLHEHMKVFSWEPLRCHDVVDVGWSKLADLNIHEGKLLGCSFNQSCVGIWVVDLACVGPYALGSNSHGNGIATINQPSQQMVDGSLKSSSVVRSNLPHVEASMKDMKLTSSVLSSENIPNTPQRAVNSITNKMPVSGPSATSSYVLPSRRAVAGKPQPNPMVQSTGKIDVVPVVVPRQTSDIKPINHMMSSEIVTSTKTENVKISSNTPRLSTPRIDMNSDIHGLDHKSPTNRSVLVPSAVLSCSENVLPQFSENEDENVNWIGSGKFRRTVSIGAERDTITQGHSRYGDIHSGRGEDPYGASRDTSFTSCIDGRRPLSVGSSAHGIDILGVRGGNRVARGSVADVHSFLMKGNQDYAEKSPTFIGDDSEVIDYLMEQHNSFTTIMQARLTKLQVVRRFWAKNDLKGGVEAMAKMADHSVLVDVLSCLVERSEAFTLEICSLLLPLLNGLLTSSLERHVSTALSVLNMLVRNFGQMIHVTRTAPPAFGVDLHAEERIERCTACYSELQVISQTLSPLLRRSGEIGKAAQELSIALQEV